jgi:hypothetical protein
MENNDNKSGEQITTKQISFGILFILILISGYIFADFLISRNKISGQKNEQQKIITPENENIDTTSAGSNLGEIHINLLKSVFYPNSNIYSDKNVYNKNVIKLAMIGEFEKASISIKGVIYNDLLNFLSLNIGSVSGTLGGVRNSENSLDLQSSTAIFSKNNPINLSIDLKSSIKLSTTKEEFKSTFQSSKDIILWDYIAPPPGSGTIAKLLVSPYTQNGNYGDGVGIEQITFSYTCKNGSHCKAEICPDKNYTYGSECIEDLFGRGSSKSYSDYFNQ